MSYPTLSLHPQEAIATLLKTLPSRRMRDVVEKRFGLKGGGKKTLEAIGAEYKITRERVRQIEVDALKHLRRDEHAAFLAPLVEAVASHLRLHGDVVAAPALLSSLTEARFHPHLSLLLSIARQFSSAPETDEYEERWAADKQKIPMVEKLLAGVSEDLEKNGQAVAKEELHRMAAARGKELFGVPPDEDTAESYLAIAKNIKRNPYGEYGLLFWSSIHPRGVRDKAHLVLAKGGAPMHFREVAAAINKAGWSKKKAHPQTVHNELIKDPRFVLVGRGLYGLREWGYEPGMVRDVVANVLKRAGRPLPRDEIVKMVSERRFVKPQTILLNLQNKSLFKKTAEGFYTVA